MFYYYGRKKRIAKFYPKSNFDTIIEPFAGSASYSLHEDNWQKNVILIEKDKKIYDIWKWLIDDATIDSISKLPNLIVGEHTCDTLQIIHGVSDYSLKAKKTKVTPILKSNWETSKKYMKNNLYKIKHWKIINDDYFNSPNLEATWFIDPPYFSKAGKGYFHSNKELDYTQLKDFILSRNGEVISCDCKEANYLPFKPLTETTGIGGKKSKEMIFYKKRDF